MFADGVKWKYRKDYISTTAKGLRSILDMGDKAGKVIGGDYSISSDIKSYLDGKKTGLSDLTKIVDKIQKLKTKTGKWINDTYIHKATSATT